MDSCSSFFLFCFPMMMSIIEQDYDQSIWLPSNGGSGSTTNDVDDDDDDDDDDDE